MKNHLKISPHRGYFILAIGIIGVLYSSCKDDTIQAPLTPTYLGYFPLEKGFWIEYSADSVVHLSTDDSLGVDYDKLIYHFEIREEIDSTFLDSEGDTTYRVSRYKRMNDTLPWDFLNLWTAKVNSRAAEREEDNIRFIKLSFPITIRATWNGNAYNDYQEEDYTYADLHTPKTFGTLSFDSTVTVIQDDFVSNINLVNKKEIYASHVGMVFKQQDSVDIGHQLGGATFILHGSEYKMQVINYKR